MGYLGWMEKFSSKHAKIVIRLQTTGLAKQEIIDYFEFENMRIHEETFCPLYAKNKKCHESEYLNCFLCGCPLFRADDQGLSREAEKIVYSKCSIGKGSSSGKNGKIHQNCSACIIPHRKKFVNAYFDTDWKQIMKEVYIGK